MNGIYLDSDVLNIYKNRNWNNCQFRLAELCNKDSISPSDCYAFFLADVELLDAFGFLEKLKLIIEIIQL